MVILSSVGIKRLLDFPQIMHVLNFPLILPGLEPQIPHYNARLKAMLDNEVNFSVAEALSEIESKGLTPNRVCVYCLSLLIPF